MGGFFSTSTLGRLIAVGFFDARMASRRMSQCLLGCLDNSSLDWVWLCTLFYPALTYPHTPLSLNISPILPPVYPPSPPHHTPPTGPPGPKATLPLTFAVYSARPVSIRSSPSPPRPVFTENGEIFLSVFFQAPPRLHSFAPNLSLPQGPFLSPSPLPTTSAPLNPAPNLISASSPHVPWNHHAPSICRFAAGSGALDNCDWLVVRQCQQVSEANSIF